MANISFRRVKVGDIGLHLAVAGPEGGKPLVFLHGFPDFWYGWRKQIEYFGQQGYYVIAPDLRGYNESDKPSSVSDYSVPLIAGDIERLIDQLSFKKPVLIGHDWGGAIAWWLAQNRSHLFDRCVILNVPHPKVMWKNILSNPKQMLKSWYVWFFQLPKLPELLINGPIIGRAGEMILKSSAAKSAFTKKDMREYRKAWSKPGAARAMVNFYRASMRNIKGPSSSDKKIPIPLLLIWGTNDVAFVNTMAEESMAHCENGKLEKVDAGHWVHVENPERVNQLIESFAGDS